MDQNASNAARVDLLFVAKKAEDPGHVRGISCQKQCSLDNRRESHRDEGVSPYYFLEEIVDVWLVLHVCNIAEGKDICK